MAGFPAPAKLGSDSLRHAALRSGCDQNLNLLAVEFDTQFAPHFLGRPVVVDVYSPGVLFR